LGRKKIRNILEKDIYSYKLVNQSLQSFLRVYKEIFSPQNLFENHKRDFDISLKMEDPSRKTFIAWP